jgi:hypothetical protein
LSFDEFFKYLTEYGYSVAPALTSDNRKEETFESARIVLIDIDKNMRLEDLAQDVFYQKYGSGYYVTPSHTAEAHRFRIIFRMDKDIESVSEMRAIYDGLLAIYGSADISCKDAARLFYGTVDCQIKEKTTRTLNAAGIAQVIAAGVSTHQPKKIPVVQKQVGFVDSYDKETLDKLKQYYPDLEYITRFKITRAVAAKFGTALAITEMRARWPDDDKTAKYESLLKDPLKPDGPSFGSLVHMIRKKEPNFRNKNFMDLGKFKL